MEEGGGVISAPTAQYGRVPKLQILINYKKNLPLSGRLKLATYRNLRVYWSSYEGYVLVISC